MAELTSETTFTVIAAPEYFEESEDLYLYPENAGSWPCENCAIPVTCCRRSSTSRIRIDGRTSIRCP